jgi:hypothetical protein
MRLAAAIHPLLPDNCGSENARPNTIRLSAIPARLTNKSGRPPTQSISCMATAVKTTLTMPTPTLARIATDAEEKPANLKIVGA